MTTRKKAEAEAPTAVPDVTRETLDATPGTIARRVAEVWRNMDIYEKMSVAALNRSSTILNWGTSGKKVLRLVETLLP